MNEQIRTDLRLIKGVTEDMEKEVSFRQGKQQAFKEVLEEIERLENTDTTWNTWKKLKQWIEKSRSSGE